MVASNTLIANPEVCDLKNAFLLWFNTSVADPDCPPLDSSDVYIVWFAYILGNAKSLISTTRHDHMYYEVTYDSIRHKIYVDAYKKFKHDELEVSSTKNVATNAVGVEHYTICI